jgi:hypothetical protein
VSRLGNGLIVRLNNVPEDQRLDRSRSRPNWVSASMDECVDKYGLIVGGACDDTQVFFAESNRIWYLRNEWCTLAPDHDGQQVRAAWVTQAGIDIDETGDDAVLVASRGE